MTSSSRKAARMSLRSSTLVISYILVVRSLIQFIVLTEQLRMSSACVSGRTCGVKALILLLSLATTPIFAQQSLAQPAAGQPQANKTSGKPKLGTPELHAPDSPDILRQMNRALEELAAKVSPAVVQIQTTGYGPLSEGGRGEAALIVRQHAVGSGVIVDSNGYIMSNAHVAEGAQRIRVALP